MAAAAELKRTPHTVREPTEITEKEAMEEWGKFIAERPPEMKKMARKPSRKNSKKDVGETRNTAPTNTDEWGKLMSNRPPSTEIVRRKSSRKQSAQKNKEEVTEEIDGETKVITQSTRKLVGLEQQKEKVWDEYIEGRSEAIKSKIQATRKPSKEIKRIAGSPRVRGGE